MAEHAYLDHLALAAETWADLWPRYRVELGGVWVSGDDQEGFGFAPAQVRFSNNMKIEALMPVRPADNDFLRRFLDSRGPGPHHVTFKVPDIRAKLVEVEAAGYRPVGISLDPKGSDSWQEFFIHPKDGPGIVVQIAQSPMEWASPVPASFPETAMSPAASLDYLSIGVRDIDATRRLFEGLLDAHVDDNEYAWSSGGRIRLHEAEDNGLQYVAFSVDNPSAVDGATPLDDGRYEVAAEANLGVRLVLTAR